MTTTDSDWGIDDYGTLTEDEKSFSILFVLMLCVHVVCVVGLTAFCMWRLHSIDMMFEAKLEVHNRQVLDRLEDLAR